jgi:hypothetical protein
VIAGAEIKSAWERAEPFEGPAEYQIRLVVGAWYVGHSKVGRPAVLRKLSSPPSTRGIVVGQVRLRFLRDVEVRVGDANDRGDVAALECLDNSVLESFVVLSMDLARVVGDGPADVEAMTSWFGSWRDLLARTAILRLTEQVGLWGELELLSRFPDPDRALAAWLGPDRQSVDFVRAGKALEVKTSTRRRVHTLRWSQAVFGRSDRDTYLVSLHVQPDPAGTSLPEQFARTAARMHDKYELRAKVLLAGYRENHEGAYQSRWRLVEDPAFFPLVEVPRLSEIPPGVLDARWRVDLSHARPLSHGGTQALLRQFVE